MQGKKKIWKKMNFCEKISSILSSQKHSKLAVSAVNKGAVNQCVPASCEYKSLDQHL